LTAVGNLLFFAAETDKGRELWKSDGTASGTRLVKDIVQGESGSYPNKLIDFDGKLYFAARNSKGVELWTSDGTNAGTKVVKDIFVGGGSSVPDGLTLIGDKLYFSAADKSHRSLWRTDGSTAGTEKIVDKDTLKPVTAVDNIRLIVGIGSKILYVGVNDEVGQELFIVSEVAGLQAFAVPDAFRSRVPVSAKINDLPQMKQPEVVQSLLGRLSRRNENILPVQKRNEWIALSTTSVDSQMKQIGIANEDFFEPVV
jgi:ELWxxDGT repeat protein